MKTTIWGIGGLVLALAPQSFASLMLVSPIPLSGTGVGSVETVLTVQATPPGPVESGCVSFSNLGASFSGGACTGSSADVKTGAGQTPTTLNTLASAGITSASNVGLIFNANQTATGPITVNSMTATFYSSSGVMQYQASTNTSYTFPDTFSGTGNSGFLFTLDSTQAAAAATAGVNSSSLIGLSINAGPANGGFETVFLANTSSSGISAVPEPATIGLAFGGIALIALRAVRRKSQA